MQVLSQLAFSQAGEDTASAAEALAAFDPGGDLLDGLLGGAALWRELPPKIFIGESGSMTGAHTDISPQLEFAHGLTGLKFLGAASYEATPALLELHDAREEEDLYATRIPTDRTLNEQQRLLLQHKELSIAVVGAGDLAVFNSGALHFASNGAGAGAAATVYHGALTPAAIPRLAEAARVATAKSERGAYVDHLHADDLTKLVSRTVDERGLDSLRATLCAAGSIEVGGATEGNATAEGDAAAHGDAAADGVSPGDGPPPPCEASRAARVDAVLQEMVEALDASEGRLPRPKEKIPMECKPAPFLGRQERRDPIYFTRGAFQKKPGEGIRGSKKKSGDKKGSDQGPAKGGDGQGGGRLLRALSDGVAADRPSGGAEWLAEWRTRIGCWWLVTPLQPQLQACAGSLAIILTRRLEHALGAPPIAAAIEPNCEWIETAEERLRLPDFPELGSFDAFALPPLPRLLLPEPAQLRVRATGGLAPLLAVSEARSQEAGTSPVWTTTAVGAGAGATVALLIGLVFFGRPRRARSVQPLHTRDRKHVGWSA